MSQSLLWEINPSVSNHLKTDSQLQNGFTCRTLTLKGWAGLATKEQAQAAIDALVEYDWLIETEIRSGGRPTVKYALNPDASADLL